MAKSIKFRLGVLLELFFNGILVTAFVVQTFVASCLLFYGYIPMPASWANRMIADQMPEHLRFQLKTVRLHPDRIALTGLEVHTTNTEGALLSVESAEMEIAWRDLRTLPAVREVSASGGTLYIPGVYAPSGQHTPLLERIALTFKPSESGWQVDRFAALHEDIRLRGSISLPVLEHTEPIDVQAWLDEFYTEAAVLTEQKKHIAYFDTPTLEFSGYPSESDGAFVVSLRASSPRLNHPEVEAVQIQLQGVLAWEETRLSALEAPTLFASRFSAPSYQLEVIDATIQIPREQFGPLLEGKWPQFQLSASQLILHDYKVEAPILDLHTADFPEVNFQGAAGGLGGAVDLNGQINTREWSGSVHARGSVDLTELAPDAVLERLPEFRFHTPPHYDLRLNFEVGFKLADAQMAARIDALQIEDLHFEQIRGGGHYADGRYTIDELYLRRGKQWIDLGFELDQKSQNYRVSLIGSAIPDDYNALLPKWWAAIFRDFDFSKTSSIYGDFIIHGNTRRKVSDLHFGHVEAREVAYRGVLLDKGSLLVRGRGPYTELRNIEATSSDGWARGTIGFASRLDAVKGPASIRLNLEAQLTLADASRLFEGDVASLIGEFETDALPRINLQAALFNQDYPEFRGKSHFTLNVDCPAALTYKGIPFDQIAFRLYGRSDAVHLRDLRFGYANGEGNAVVDIATPPDQTPHLRYKLDLIDSEQNLALANLPQFSDIRESLQPGAKPTPEAESPDRKAARVDLQLHGKGPANDIWGHSGFGRFEIRNERLATIQLLGPLSKLLQTIELDYTSFNLDTMHGDFTYEDNRAHFEPLQIDGLRAQIKAPGTFNLRDQSIDMRVSVFLFRNAGDPDSRLRQLGELLKRPIPNLLEFELTGTLQEQRFRSLYDPRNLIPNL